MTDGRTYLEMASCQLSGDPGYPALPAYGVKLLLPPGEAIASIDVIPGNRIITAEGAQIDPMNRPIIISKQGPHSPTAPNQDIYGSNSLYPAELAQNIRTEYFRGYSIGYFIIYPVQYNPVTGEVSYYPEITVTVNTEPNSKSSQAHSQMYRGSAVDRERLTGKVDNPQSAETYGAVISAGTDDPIVPYLLITIPQIEPAFQDLIDLKTQCGLVTEVVYVSDIYSTYPGSDDQKKIRNCIIDYYQNFSTEYVLLAGDVEHIPHRGLWATLSGETDPDIPGDIYYAALDGNWDTDNDGNYGENGEGDLVSEVIIGRAAVDDVIEAYSFVYKQMMYQTQPVADELETALMVGEDLGWVTWGSDLKEQIRLGTGSTAAIPANFDVRTLYDTPSWSWSASGDLTPMLNEGPNLVNHMGHASTTYMMKYNNNNVNDNAMTNDGTNHNFYIIYSQGCYCGAYDNRNTQQGSYTSDCISEKFSTISHGAVAMITNSRYGWGDYSGLNGPSQYFDRQFFDAIFGEHITRIGIANQDSKEDNIPFINNATLWCYYELNLLADPSLDIWTSEPVDINASYLPNIFVGQDEFEIEVPGVINAYCALSNSTGLLGTDYTNAVGNATIVFDEPLASLDTLTLAITAHNSLPYFDEIYVITPDMPYMIVEDIMVNDYNIGDGDNILDLGETACFAITFQNVGLQAATAVTAELIIDDEYITVVNGILDLGDIDPESTITEIEAFEIEVSAEIPDEHEIMVSILMQDDLDNTWTQSFTFTASAPAAAFYNAQVSDPDNRLNPGDTADLTITLMNSGSGEVRMGEASIMTDSPYISFSVSTANVDLIAGGESQTLEPPFTLTVSNECPDNIVIPVYLELTDECGYHCDMLFELSVGGFFDNFENGVGDWTHEAATAGWNDEWFMNTYRNHSPAGASSWHCGSDMGGNYSDTLDAALMTPPMEMEQDAKLKIWHWMEAEVSQSYPGTCYDAGLVEMSLNGSAFFPIAPEGGYPYEIRYGSSGGVPLPEGTYCFSGQHDWEQAIFDLSLYPAGTVQFRFRFCADGSTTLEGWYIDDVEFVYLSESNPPANVQASLNEDIVHVTWNSPNIDPPEFTPGKATGSSEIDGLLGYKIYRDGALIAEDLTTLEYFDDLSGMPEGDYAYQVSALYDAGESSLSPEVIVHYPDVGVEELTGSIPDDFFLDQNFPNPFNPETSFRFGLPQDALLNFTVYNIQGQEVARLWDGFKPAGYHSMTWNANTMPSGIYFYRIHAGSFNQTGKMLLLK